MIRIKSAYHNEYVVYDTRDFSNHHTHTKSLKVAKIIRSNIIHNRLPKTKEIRLLESHLRVATDLNYRRGLLVLIQKAEEMRVAKSGVIRQLMMEKSSVPHQYHNQRDISHVNAHYQFLIFLSENGWYQPTSYFINDEIAEAHYVYGPICILVSTNRHSNYTIKLKDKAIHTEEVRVVPTAKEAILHTQRLLDFIGGE